MSALKNTRTGARNYLDWPYVVPADEFHPEVHEADKTIIIDGDALELYRRHRPSFNNGHITGVTLTVKYPNTKIDDVPTALEVALTIEQKSYRDQDAWMAGVAFGSFQEILSRSPDWRGPVTVNGVEDFRRVENE